MARERGSQGSVVPRMAGRKGPQEGGEEGAVSRIHGAEGSHR